MGIIWYWEREKNKIIYKMMNDEAYLIKKKEKKKGGNFFSLEWC